MDMETSGGQQPGPSRQVSINHPAPHHAEQDDQGNTFLHREAASSSGIDFEHLLEQLEQKPNYMTIVNQYNKQHETALSLAIDNERFDIAVLLLSLGETNSQLDGLVSVDSEKFERLVLYVEKRNKKKIINLLVHKASQLKRNRHGGDYQLKWLMHFSLQGNNDDVKFRLGTEVAGNKFDDLVFRYKDSNENIRYIYLQAKHEQHLGKTISGKRKKLTQTHIICELKKYFTTYLRQEPSEVDSLILCTNSKINFDPKEFHFGKISKEEIENKYKIFADLGGKLYKFTSENENDKNGFIKKLFGSDVSSDDKNKIKQLLSKFVFAVEQPGSIALGNKIKNKMGSDAFNFISYGCYFQHISEWFSQRYENDTARYLLSSEIKHFFDGLKYKIADLELNGLASLYNWEIEIFKSSDLRFEAENMNIKSIKEFLESQPTNKILKVVHKQESAFLSIAKVYQALKLYYKYIYEYTVSDLNSLYLLNSDTSNPGRVVSAFKSENKRILMIECSFIDKNGQELITNLYKEVLAGLNRKNKKIIFILNEKVNQVLEEILPIDNQTELMKTQLNEFELESQNKLLDKEIIFQGNKIKLKRFLGINNLSEQKSNLLYEAIDEDLLVQLINNEEIEIVTKLPDLNDCDSSYYNPHYVEMLRSLQTPPLGNYCNMKIIMDEPGMGKSTKLVRLAKEMKDNNGSKWIIFVKLTSYRKQLESSELKNGLSFLNEVENLKPTNFKKKILEYCIQKDRVVLFLDGLDEILPKYKDRVIQLLNLTQNTWITTRECSSIEKSLKNNFVCYRLEPLTPNQQKDFLMKYFEKLSPDLKATRIENLSKEILNKTKDIGESFASNILHLKMLAEIYLSEGKLNLFQLYQKFAEKKYDIYFEEKIKLDQSGVINFDYLKRLAIIQLEKAHRRLAVSILFPEWGRRLLNSEEVITFEDKKLESFEKQELQRVGFMRYVDNDISSFNFIHHTYAEYFIANFLSDVLLKKRSKQDTKYRVVKDFLHEEILIEKDTKCNRNTNIHTFLRYRLSDDSYDD